MTRARARRFPLLWLLAAVALSVLAAPGAALAGTHGGCCCPDHGSCPCPMDHETDGSDCAGLDCGLPTSGSAPRTVPFTGGGLVIALSGSMAERVCPARSRSRVAEARPRAPDPLTELTPALVALPPPGTDA